MNRHEYGDAYEELEGFQTGLDPVQLDLFGGSPGGSEIPAARILRRSAEIIEQRAASRDQPNGEKSMAKAVQMFNVCYGTCLTEVQGWHFMELLKMVRSAYGCYTPDDYEDKLGYAALAAEAAENENKGE